VVLGQAARNRALELTLLLCDRDPEKFRRAAALIPGEHPARFVLRPQALRARPPLRRRAKCKNSIESVGENRDTPGVGHAEGNGQGDRRLVVS
jgi:hypothetical protein